jgi:hypothetical protein
LFFLTIPLPTPAFIYVHSFVIPVIFQSHFLHLCCYEL